MPSRCGCAAAAASLGLPTIDKRPAAPTRMKSLPRPWYLANLMAAAHRGACRMAPPPLPPPLRRCCQPRCCRGAAARVVAGMLAAACAIADSAGGRSFGSGWALGQPSLNYPLPLIVSGRDSTWAAKRALQWLLSYLRAARHTSRPVQGSTQHATHVHAAPTQHQAVVGVVTLCDNHDEYPGSVGRSVRNNSGHLSARLRRHGREPPSLGRRCRGGRSGRSGTAAAAAAGRCSRQAGRSRRSRRHRRRRRRCSLRLLGRPRSRANSRASRSVAPETAATAAAARGISAAACSRGQRRRVAMERARRRARRRGLARRPGGALLTLFVALLHWLHRSSQRVHSSVAQPQSTSSVHLPCHPCLSPMPAGAARRLSPAPQHAARLLERHCEQRSISWAGGTTHLYCSVPSVRL